VVNRVGFETGNVRGKSAPGQGLEFWGGSFFCDPFGRVLAEASHDKEEILLGEVDLHQIEDVRRNWPFLRDRRIDSYTGITSRMLDAK
jgi:N-carbamoylputrescine amidase